MADKYKQGQADYAKGRTADTNRMTPQERDKYAAGQKDAKNK